MSKILVVGPAWVGDMVMAQCLFKVLKKRGAEIDVLAPQWSLPLLERMPEVTAAITLPIGHGELALGKRYQLAQKLRQKNYSEAIVLPNSFKSALIPFLAGIPKRTGWRGEMRYVLLNDLRVLDKQKYSLMIERFMALGFPKNEEPPTNIFPQLMVKEENIEKVKAKFEIKTTRPILALCPGAEFGPAKRWPEQYYAEVALQKIREGFEIWIFGSTNDAPIAETITQLTHHRAVNFCGKTSLAEAIDLLSLVSGVVTNDSGLMHIAAALQKQLVAVYGPTSAGFTPPLYAGAKTVSLTLSCQPCFERECPLKHHRCMQELAPELVLNSMSEWKD